MLRMSMDIGISFLYGEGVLKEWGVLRFVEIFFVWYFDEVLFWFRFRYGRLGKRENEDVFGFDLFFLDFRRGEVYNIVNIMSEF